MQNGLVFNTFIYDKIESKYRHMGQERQPTESSKDTSFGTAGFTDENGQVRVQLFDGGVVFGNIVTMFQTTMRMLADHIRLES